MNRKPPEDPRWKKPYKSDQLFLKNHESIWNEMQQNFLGSNHLKFTHIQSKIVFQLNSKRNECIFNKSENCRLMSNLFPLIWTLSLMELKLLSKSFATVRASIYPPYAIGNVHVVNKNKYKVSTYCIKTAAKYPNGSRQSNGNLWINNALGMKRRWHEATFGFLE